MNARESTVDFFGHTFKAVEWNPYYHGNGVDNPWLDEALIRKKYWTSFASGQVVIDVGACFGLYTLPALMQGCRVVALEPNKEFLDIITESVSMNEGFANNYIGCNFGLWNNTPYPPELEKSVLEWCRSTEPLTTTTLDELTQNLDRVDMVKIDVEGAEVGVLEGAVEMIKKHRPTFLIEDHTGLYDYCNKHDTGAAVRSILHSHGYKMIVELFGGPPPPAGGRYFIFATPMEK